MSKENVLKTSPDAGLSRTESPVKSPVDVRVSSQQRFVDAAALSESGELRRAAMAVPVLYFITAKGRSDYPIKIGRSTVGALKARMSQIQVGMPYRLEVLFVMEAEPSFEAKLHEAWAKNRMSGEWFERTAELYAIIKEMSAEFPHWRTEFLGRG